MTSTSKLLLWTTILSATLFLGVRWYYSQEQAQAERLLAYNALLGRAHYQRLDYEQRWNTEAARRPEVFKRARTYLYETLTDSIFGFWYGTPWDFNGTTQQPGQGAIACGYFVTTTLQQVGFSLPRRRLAQQAASVIIRTLCARSSIEVFNTLEALNQHMLKQAEGLYLVGLDTHVGYLWRHAEGWNIVHASYSGGKHVASERWDQSTVLQKSKIFVVGNLLGNNALVQQWVEGTPITLSE